MPATSSDHVFNARDYGATGDGRTDDTAALVAAVAAASPQAAPTGDTVYLPAGRYRVTSAVTLPAATTLAGAGWNTPGSQANTFAGSWLQVDAGAPFSPVVLSGGGSALRNVAFNVPDQPTDRPAPAAGPMVHVTGNNALVEDVLVYNPYAGVFIDGAAQATLRRIFGQPLRYGIMVDRSQDTNYIDTVHFWPYWQPAKTLAGVAQLAEGTGIMLLRSDNPHLSNVFALNYARGLSLSASAAGCPHKVHLANADFDGCVTGIHIAAPGRAGYAATMQLTNVSVQSPSRPGAPVGHGLWVEQMSSFAMVQASNLRISNSGLNAVRIDADNVAFHGENVSLENWRAEEAFHIAAATSFAYLGAGFSTTPGRPACAPRSQFRLAHLE
jgi:Pectate lyase superfamily protein